MSEKIIFEALLAQLRHPVYRMKLITAHKIAELMSLENADAYQEQFLKWLSERVYESEVITGLSILGLVEKNHLIDQSLVRSHIKKPSILSDMYLEEIYASKTHYITWSEQHSGSVPGSFRIPHGFQETSTHYVAPIFKHDFEWIEERYGPPLFYHWAWEYDNLKELLGDYETSHSYFLEDHDRWEYTGSYHFKMSDALQSAYLRTLNFAVSHLEMPLGFARDLATNAITLDFDLEKVSTSKKPEILNLSGELDFSESTTPQNLSDLTKEIFESPDGILVAASFPLCRNKNYAADLDLVSFLSNEEGDFTDIEFFEGRDIHLPKRFDFHDWAGQKAIFDHMKEPIDEKGVYSAAFRIMPLRFTRWQNELVIRGLYVPSPLLIGDNYRVSYDEQQISFKNGEEVVAKWVFWLDNWRPCHLNHLYSGIGTALFVKREIIEKNLEKNGFRLGIAAKLNYLSRERDYGHFENRHLDSNVLIF
jgi:hypothetical protein